MTTALLLLFRNNSLNSPQPELADLIRACSTTNYKKGEGEVFMQWVGGGRGC